MQPIEDTAQGHLYRSLLRGCPACKSGRGFFAGPRGGAALNIMCRNPNCRMEFNVCETFGCADRGGKADSERFDFFHRYPGWQTLVVRWNAHSAPRIEKRCSSQGFVVNM